MDESNRKWLRSELKLHCKGMSKGEMNEFVYYSEIAYDKEVETAKKAGSEEHVANEVGFETIMGRLNYQIEEWKEGAEARAKIKPYPKGEQLSLGFNLDCSPKQTFPKG